MTTDIWHDYECGRISQDECYSALAQRCSDQQIRPQDIADAMQHSKDSLEADFEFVDFIKQLKQSSPHLRIFALSNVSLPDFAALRLKPADWGVFERVFTSGEIGERKPNLGGFKHLVAATGIDPHQAIFVDDKLENVFSAESLGFRGIVFDNAENVKRTLLNLLCDPVARGNSYLQANAGMLQSVLGTTEENAIPLPENFAQLLILEATGNRSLISLVEPKNEHGRWNYFHDPKFISKEPFPCDLDTTSMATKLLGNDNPAQAHNVMDQIKNHLTKDGLPLTYFDLRRPRLDAGVCACVVALFYSFNRGHEVPQMVAWLLDILRNRAFSNGTYYYVHPEYFLYSIVRLLNSTNDKRVHSQFTPLLRECVQEQIGQPGDALSLAMRIVVCNYVDISNDVDMKTMLSHQRIDGGWDMSWVYQLPSKGIKVGNRGLTTAVAVKAIQGFPSATSSSPPHAFPTLSMQESHSPLLYALALGLSITASSAVTFGLSRLYYA